MNARICGRAATDRFLLLGWPSADALSPSDFCRFLGRLTGEDTKTGHIQDRGKGPCKPQRHVVKLLALMGALGGDRAAGGGSPYPWHVRCCTFGSDGGIHYKCASSAVCVCSVFLANGKLRRKHRRSSERIRQLRRRETGCHGLSRTWKSQSRSLRKPIIIVQAYQALVTTCLSRAAPRHSRLMCWAIIQGRKSNFGVTRLALLPMRQYSCLSLLGEPRGRPAGIIFYSLNR